MSTNQILLGIGLVLVLAVSAQLVARPLRVPALVVLLPAGFVAGILTDDVHPDRLLGPLYQPFVSVAVGIILFEAGLRLSYDEIGPAVRSAVIRLVVIGALVTWVVLTLTVALLYSGMDRGVALLIGAILVVSGPTVVLPLLAFIRPSRDVRSILKWEGTLIDPVGALLGVLVFADLSAGTGWQPGSLIGHLIAGVLVALVGAPVLLVLLSQVQRHAPRMVVPTVTMVVVAAVVAGDVFRDDAGLTAAVIMGIAVGNQRRVDVSHSLYEFHETLVQLLIGVMFVLVAASVSPHQVADVMPAAIALLAAMILVVRPLAVLISMVRTSTSARQRAFIAWMAPRGIVAGATAAAFGPQLAQQHVAGAEHVLPLVFVSIFGTVVVYGLTATPLARFLGLAGAGGRVVLVVGGHPWARDIAAALHGSGVGVRIWAGPSEHQAAARAAGLEVDQGRIMVDAVTREAELEDVTDVLLMTSSDDFNTLGAAELRDELGRDHVFRLAPEPDRPNLLPPARSTDLIGATPLTYAELDQRIAAGAKIVTRPAGGDGAETRDLALIAIGPDRRLQIATPGRPIREEPGEAVVVLTTP